jgi:hypothetical protein
MDQEMTDMMMRMAKTARITGEVEERRSRSWIMSEIVLQGKECISCR